LEEALDWFRKEALSLNEITNRSKKEIEKWREKYSLLA
jgi:hypothetical protein